MYYAMFSFFKTVTESYIGRSFGCENRCMVKEKTTSIYSINQKFGKTIV